MNFSELIQAVQRNVQDDSRISIITGINIGDMINRSVLEIAGGLHSVLGSWITPPLPNLFTIGTVTTSTSAPFVTMPINFQRDLQFAASSHGSEIDLANSFISFSENNPLLNLSGPITECIAVGNNFYYQRIPVSAESVTLHYYRFPVVMVNSTDSPDGIPLHLHESLLVNYTCWKIFDLIKDFSMEQLDIITTPFKERFYEALKILELFIPYDSRVINLKG